MAKNFSFRCTTTGRRVEARTAFDEQRSDGTRRYEAVHCVACNRIHIINPATGRSMSDEADSPER
jgi:hypothetical protein